MSRFNKSEKAFFSSLLSQLKGAHEVDISSAPFVVSEVIVQQMLEAFKLRPNVTRDRWVVCNLIKLTALFKELYPSAKHRPTQASSRRSNVAGAQFRKGEGAALKVAEEDDKAEKLARKAEYLDEINKSSRSLITNVAALLCPTTDSRSGVVTTQNALQKLFVKIADVQRVIAPDVPVNASMKSLARDLFENQKSIARKCITTNWGMSFINSLNSNSNFIEPLSATSTVTNKRKLPGGDRKSKRAKRSIIASIKPGTNNITTAVFDTFTSFSNSGARLALRLDEREKRFREQVQPIVSLLPSEPFVELTDDASAKRKERISQLCLELKGLLFDEHESSMSGITPHSKVIGVAVGLDGTTREVHVGTTVNKDLVDCIKASLGQKPIVVNKTTLRNTKHKLFTDIATTTPITGTV